MTGSPVSGRISVATRRNNGIGSGCGPSCRGLSFVFPVGEALVEDLGWAFFESLIWY